ncbi:hypothetical protein VVD49_10955 [Uliginosibacterium sp. H3]|uniref:Uncharacterized protein n=1 Tax=Uliginosibacterium silvisoli TaxID=3114758 RepID=A0ABU6K3H6_9RHOO|nr:hypothetical protein [Uliginosibacterium sp. H3]
MILVALFAGVALSGPALADPGPKSQTKQARAAKPSSTAAKKRPVPARIQPSILRYTDLASLPRQARREFHGAPDPTPDNADEPEVRCANPDVGGSGVPPCLGLFRNSEPRKPVSFSFELALKSLAAPKDIFVGQCPMGSNSLSCNNAVAEARAEQERLANTLDRQRRSPVGTFGIAVDF